MAQVKAMDNSLVERWEDLERRVVALEMRSE
jgi:hypothetical protein